jgi:uncharacterized membrane-anchored protein YitT (DUF2179 family)
VNKKHPVLRLLMNLVLIQLGAFVVAVGLEEFLIPNNMLDGGVVGISILLAYLTKLPFGLLLVIANLPFLVIGYHKLGRKFVVLTLYAVVSLSLWATFFHPIREITKDLFLSAIFGGLFVGMGVGLIIRNGACLDGTEILAIILSKKLPFSLGEIVMFFNVFIFTAAGFVFGIDKALYSIAAYLIAYKLIDIVIMGINQSHSLFIVTQKPDEVSARLMEEFKTGVTVLKGMGGYSKKETDILYLIIGKLEINKAKELILDVDTNAFITIQTVQEMVSVNSKKHH